MQWGIYNHLKKEMCLLALFGLMIVPMKTYGQNPLDQYRWENRIVLVKVNDFQNADYQAQKKLYLTRNNQLKDRQLLIIGVGEVIAEIWDDKPSDFSAGQIKWLRNKYLKEAQQVLIGKDGGVKLRTNGRFALDKLFGTIDRMPMRQAEMRRKSNYEG